MELRRQSSSDSENVNTLNLRGQTITASQDSDERPQTCSTSPRVQTPPNRISQPSTPREFNYIFSKTDAKTTRIKAEKGEKDSNKTKKFSQTDVLGSSKIRFSSSSPSLRSKSFFSRSSSRERDKSDSSSQRSPRKLDKGVTSESETIRRVALPPAEFRSSSAQKQPYSPQPTPAKPNLNSLNTTPRKYSPEKNHNEDDSKDSRSMISPRDMTDFAHLTRENLIYSPLTLRMSSSTENTYPKENMMDIAQLQTYGIAITTLHNGKKVIKSGKIDRIIFTLLDWLVTDPSRKVLSYWKQPALHPNILLFLGSWFDIQFLDFSTSPAKSMIEEFIQSIPRDHRKLLTAKISVALKPENTERCILFDSPLEKIQNISSLQLQPGRFGFTDIPIDLFAEIWTLLDFKNFLEISRSEFFDTKGPRPAWTKMMNRATLLSQFVTSEIVQTVDISARAKLIARFIKLALKFLEIQNYNGLMCIWGGLNTGPLNRLTRTKKKLSHKIQLIWNALEFRLSQSDDFGQLRSLMAKQLEKREVVMPWFELIDKHRNYVDQYDDIVKIAQDPNLYLNFTKVSNLGKQLLTLEEYQKLISTVELPAFPTEPRRAQLTSTIFDYLGHLPTFNEELLWKFSFLNEKA